MASLLYSITAVLPRRQGCGAIMTTQRRGDASPPRRSRPPMANAYTVLVVDAEPPILRFLRTSLTAAGHHVVTARDAADALAKLAGEKPDLMILDLGLPDRSGLEVIAEIRRRSAV